jgi:hypothetical protein
VSPCEVYLRYEFLFGDLSRAVKAVDRIKEPGAHDKRKGGKAPCSLIDQIVI